MSDVQQSSVESQMNAPFTVESKHVCAALDGMGYSTAQVQFRRDLYDETGQSMTRVLQTISGEEMDFSIVGSKGEGLTSVYESDQDLLYTVHSVICIEKDANNANIPSSSAAKAKLTMNMDLCSSGYTLLATDIHPGIDRHMYCRLEDDKYYLNNDSVGYFFASGVRESIGASNPEISKLQRQGATVAVKCANGEVDQVFSFPAHCPGLFEEWNARPRPHNFPSLELRQQVVAMGANLVAKGSGESDLNQLEWRICFNKGEILLMRNLNSTQIKLYILLKMILKNILCPKNKELTSFIMKNIVLWMAEMYPPQMFTEDNLLAVLMKALKMLKKSIQIFSLPYYMIPSRNLFASKMSEQQQRGYVRQLRQLIRTGPNFLFQCKKIKIALTMMSLEQLEWFKDWRNEVEQLAMYLKLNKFVKQHCGLQVPAAQHSALSQEQMEHIVSRLMSLVSPNWLTLALEGLDIETEFNELFKWILC